VVLEALVDAFSTFSLLGDFLFEEISDEDWRQLELFGQHLSVFFAVGAWQANEEEATD
jgi:hypothetical protein